MILCNKLIINELIKFEIKIFCSKTFLFKDIISKIYIHICYRKRQFKENHRNEKLGKKCISEDPTSYFSCSILINENKSIG